jgi:AraC-like DNA-binding protein
MRRGTRASSKKGIMNILQDTLAACRSLSIFLLVADNAAMLLAGGSALIVSLAISRKYKKNLSAKNPLKIAGSGPYSKNGHTKKTDKIGRFFPNQEKINQTSFLINEFLVKNKPFLQQKYALRNLARDVNIPLHYLSAFINHYHKMHFNDFINRYRVAHSKEMIMNGECKYKTLEAISFESGFSNRNTFTSAFKKETSQSPSQFLREIIKNSKRNAMPWNALEKSTCGTPNRVSLL